MSSDEPNRGTSTSLLKERKVARDLEELKKFVENSLDADLSTRKVDLPEADGSGTRLLLGGGVTCTSTNHYVIKDERGRDC